MYIYLYMFTPSASSPPSFAPGILAITVAPAAPLPTSSPPVTPAHTSATPCQVCVRFADEDGQQEEEWEGRIWDEHAHAPNEYPNSTYKRLRVLWRATTPFARGCSP